MEIDKVYNGINGGRVRRFHEMIYCKGVDIYEVICLCIICIILLCRAKCTHKMMPLQNFSAIRKCYNYRVWKGFAKVAFTLPFPLFPVPFNYKRSNNCAELIELINSLELYNVGI